MIRLNRMAIAAAASLMLAGAARAADVKITGLHNCCGACKKALDTTLAGAAVSNIVIDNSNVSFTASEPDKAVKALYDAGFGGKVEGAKTPEAAGAKGVKGKTLKFDKLHNCCGGCTKAIQDALKPFGTNDLKPKAAMVTVTSDKEIEAEAVIKALRAAGYNAVYVK